MYMCRRARRPARHTTSVFSDESKKRSDHHMNHEFASISQDVLNFLARWLECFFNIAVQSGCHRPGYILSVSITESLFSMYLQRNDVVDSLHGHTTFFFVRYSRWRSHSYAESPNGRSVAALSLERVELPHGASFTFLFLF